MVAGAADQNLGSVHHVFLGGQLRLLQVKLYLVLLEGVHKLPDDHEHGVDGHEAGDHRPELPWHDLGLWREDEWCGRWVLGQRTTSSGGRGESGTRERQSCRGCGGVWLGYL